MKRIAGISSGGGLATRPYRIDVYKNNRNRYAKYEIYFDDMKIARTDTEEKARIFIEALNMGVDFGISLVRKKL